MWINCFTHNCLPSENSNLKFTAMLDIFITNNLKAGRLQILYLQYRVSLSNWELGKMVKAAAFQEIFKAEDHIKAGM